MTVKSLLAAVMLVFGMCAWAQRAVSWHHSNSPFRAVFEVKETANHPEAGTVIEVPCCGTGDREGKDVFCYDEHGTQLKRMQIGRSSQERCMVLVRPEKNSKMVYAYFGSGMSAPKVEFKMPLICSVYALPKGPCRGRAQAEKLLAEAKLVGRKPVRRICEVSNPLSEDLKFIMVFEGNLQTAAPQKKMLFVASSNPAYLYLNGQPFIERAEVASYHNSIRGEFRKEADLKAGLTPIKLVAFSLDGSPKFLGALGRCQMKGKEVGKVDFVDGNEFVHGGECVLQKVEGRNKTTSLPQFTYRHVSHISMEDVGYLTETELWTYSGQEAEWVFSDGIVMKGAKITRIFAELNAMSVKVTVKREHADGRVTFSMVAPRERNANNVQDFNYYAGILKTMGLEKMTKANDIIVLLAFMQYSDNHALQVPLAKAFLKSRHSARGEREALLCLARAGSTGGRKSETVKDAKDAWEKLLKGSHGKEERADCVSEAVEFAVFCQRDCALAEKWLQTYGTAINARLRSSLLMDIYLQSNRQKEAAGEYQKLMEGKRFGETQRSSAVRGSSFEEEALRATEQGRLIAARAALEEWATESPIDRGNGSFSLARAKFFEARGWLEGAEGELQGAIGADAELPNLPEVEYELAKVQKKLGKGGEAKKLFRKVAERYPNHPLAKEAAKER